MKPTKIMLELTPKVVQLKVFAAETAKGYLVIESTPFVNGIAPKEKTLVQLRKHGQAYAKRFDIPFIDESGK